MAMNLVNLQRVRRLAGEVESLSHRVQAELTASGYHYGSKTSAELRRRSMDLTRALADLRKANG